MYQYSVPERWNEYKSIGEVISGTKFVAFKVPLKKEILSAVHENDRFGPEDVIEKIKEKGHVLGLVIDITYTDRYYHQTEFIEKKIEHEKIYTGGHDVPSDAVVYRFFDVVEKFIMKNKNEKMVIGVHCTHGVNRTGYIVCRYMVERLGIDPTKAMEDFNKARGHPIERKPYIDDLLSRKYNPDYVIGDHPPVLKKVKNYNKRNNYSNKPWPRNKTHDMTPSAMEVKKDRQFQRDFQSLTLNNSSHAFDDQDRSKQYERGEKEQVERENFSDREEKEYKDKLRKLEEQTVKQKAGELCSSRGELQKDDDRDGWQGRESPFTDHRPQPARDNKKALGRRGMINVVLQGILS
ncbi:unnamed protein product [Mytilus coruscus]|uniref:Tyrosine specific protein phosphatases domain-containing protein n=1 Tax=Mytilus coruscus TaxID=42192 RepID=A0A6J8A5L6_MYTCO|nr:unnamed protein product [Mytilus coruscus]